MIDEATIDRIKTRLTAALTALADALEKDVIDLTDEHGSQIAYYLARWLMNEELGREPDSAEFDSLMARIQKNFEEGGEE